MGGDALDGFGAWLKLSRSMALNTVKAYIRDISLAARWAKDGKLASGPEDLTLALIRRYIAGLISGGVSRRSVARKIAAFRAFGEYLVESGLSETNPALALRVPKQERPLPPYVSKETIGEALSVYGPESKSRVPTELEQLKAFMPFADELLQDEPGTAGESGLPPSLDSKTPVGMRNHVLFELIYSSGLRIGECVSLNVADIHLHHRQMTVIGKGGKPRICVFGRRAANLLFSYLARGGARELLLSNT
ncbi:MAG: site-specific integrase, partial [bacterium]